MKNYKQLGLLLTIFSVVACSDLEEEPIGQLAPEGLYTTVSDVQSTINGGIAIMASEEHWGRKANYPVMLRSDMADSGDPANQQARRDIDLFTMTADNSVTVQTWRSPYRVIAANNAAIEGAKLVDDLPENINPVVGQAYFWRAFNYYHLVRLFGNIPYIDTVVDDFQTASTLPRTPEAEVYQNIIADLELAKLYLPDTQPARALPSKASAAALLASVHLTLENFQEAYNEAKFVIDGEGRFELNLEPDYQDLFVADKTQGLKESLVNIDFNSATNGNNGNDYWGAITGIGGNDSGNYNGGWSLAVPTIAVYNDWDGRDYRKAVSLDTVAIKADTIVRYQDFPLISSRNSASDRPHIAKYFRFPGAAARGAARATARDYSLMRYAEVLLIAAEALNENSAGSAEAASYVNRVRARARNRAGVMASFPEDVPAGLSQDEFRDLVLNERKWELSFEFKRWFDIKRRNLAPQVFGAQGYEQRNFDPAKDYLFPIPQDELISNPSLEQNTGY